MTIVGSGNIYIYLKITDLVLAMKSREICMHGFLHVHLGLFVFAVTQHFPPLILIKYVTQLDSKKTIRQLTR